MDAFSYLSVLLSVIVGLAVTQVLQGYRGLLLARRQVRLYMPTLAWSVLILLIAIQFWWASFGLRTHVEWTFLSFLLVLLQGVVLYMLAGVALPDVVGETATDLRAHYFRERVSFGVLLLALLAVSLLKSLALDGNLGDRTNLVFHGAFAAAAVVLLATRRPWVHAVLAPGTVLLLAAYIGVLFARL